MALFPLAAFVFALTSATPFSGIAPHPPEGEPGAEAPAEIPPEALDRLYDELSAAESKGQADATAAQIQSLWESSGSATADLLTERASQAMLAEDQNLAELHLDDALRIAPDFAEGWVRRAELHALRDEHSEAVAALERALAADPRHYRALMLLARTLESMNAAAGAYEAYGEALKVHPFLEEAIEERERLEPLVEGRAL